MRVHFASGSHPFDAPWVNTDFEDLAGVDILADLLSGIPSELRDIEISYVGHFLEHLTREEGVDFLRRVHERTADGGKLVIVGPDVAKAQALFDHGLLPLELLEATQAHGYIPDDQPNNRAGIHIWDCTGDAVLNQCLEAGWDTAQEIPLGRLHSTIPEVPIIDSAEWQFCIIAENK